MLINECIFLFTGRWAYDLGGGGGISGGLLYFHTGNKNYIR